jgi:ABC-type phosphate/phosphonate transport system substrate-binding protein
MNRCGQSARRGCGLAAAWLICAVVPFTATGAEHVPDAAAGGLRIAVSESVAGEVNGNDLRAAIKTWAEAVARQTGVRIDAEVCTSAQLIQKIRNRQVDGFSVNILEFARIAAFADREIILDASQVPDGEEYLLLVHQSGGIQSLADLRGRSLLLYQNPRTCLDRIWLDVLLAAAHLGAADTFLGRIDICPKLSRVVLPVFFRQTDACIVTRRGYNTMCELNPQLARQLHPLAVSPKMMAGFLAFHKDSPAETRKKFLGAITEVHKSVEGQQALTLFGGTRLVRVDVSVLQPSLDLLRAYERLKGKTPAAGQ